MKTYTVYYYNDNHERYQTGIIFESQFGAVYHARRIRDSYGYQTEVMDNETGAILAYFDTLDRSFIDENDIEPDARKLAALVEEC